MNLQCQILPVGHGACCLEDWYDDNEKDVKIRILYDCGSRSIKNGEINKNFDKKIIDKYIREPEIDALFLSHLDADHISGVSTLLTQHKVKKVIIPRLIQKQEVFYLLKYRKCLCNQNNDIMYNILKYIYNLSLLKTKTEAICVNPINYNNELETSSNRININEEGANLPLNYRCINSGVSIAISDSLCFWQYTPCNFDLTNNKKIDEYSNEISSLFNSNGEVNKKEFEKMIFQKNSIKRLKNFYKAIYKDTNDSSMTLYSGPSADIKMINNYCSNLNLKNLI